MKYPLLPLVAACLFAPALSRADVTLPAIFSEHMVLEKTAKVPIWGKASPGEEVTVKVGDQTANAKAGEDGAWKAVLDLSKSGPGPFVATVKGNNEITIPDVVVGEVWVASGQSNMEWVLANTIDAQKEIASSANPMLRQFRLTKNAVEKPTSEFTGVWEVAGPETSGKFTAVGYYFGKDLQKAINQPVGLIYTNWGGTPSEAWTSPDAIASVPDLQQSLEKQQAYAKEFPGLRAKFTEDFKKWLDENNRADKTTPDIAAFAGEKVAADGWAPVKFPAKLTAADGSPFYGAIWLRREFDLPKTDKPIRIDVGNVDGFEALYWNGQLVKENTYATLPGNAVRRTYDIPASAVKEGRNVVAMRIYSPGAQPMVQRDFDISGANPAGPTVSKPEYALAAPAADKAAPKLPAPAVSPQNTATYLFNGMINPILSYAISGAIWYQGESNAGRSYQYRMAFPLMITDWRKQWGQGDFPFYFVQLANYLAKETAPAESGWAELREAQSMTLKLPNTGQAVIIDAGESDDIHPRNKQVVGERLARIALAKDYGQKDLVYSGPTYQAMKVDGSKVRLSFDHVGGGLVAKELPATYIKKSQTNETAPLVRNSPSSELEGFAICGDDKKWVWAEAKIDGNEVVVWSDKVPAPVAVRYAWANNPTCNLFNKEGLPASPFRTDDFPGATANGKY